MEARGYTKYSSTRIGSRKFSQRGSRHDARRRRHEPAPRGPNSAEKRLFRRATTLAIIVGLALAAYACGIFGYGYLEARAGQSDLRSLFSISGNGSVDSGYLADEAAAMQAHLDYLEPVGEISISAIDVKWMIVEGSDDAALAKGPGHIIETQLPGADGNFAVAGDRVLYGAPFLDLDEVRVGDRITVRMPYATFVYRVTDSFIVTPDDVSVLQPTGDEVITLLTCDPPWDIKQRIVIRGRLDEVLPAGSAA
ncbi:MAG: sortase [Thermoleophilia bacterium]